MENILVTNFAMVNERMILTKLIQIFLEANPSIGGIYKSFPER